jgi:hypothetical protein
MECFDLFTFLLKKIAQECDDYWVALPENTMIIGLLFQVTTRFAVEDFFPMSRSTQERRKISTGKLPTRKSNFLRFVTQALRSNFKKLIVTSPALLRGLHQMSILKTVPEGLKPPECERIKLRELLPVPYVPLKDEVQDEMARGI